MEWMLYDLFHLPPVGGPGGSFSTVNNTETLQSFLGNWVIHFFRINGAPALFMHALKCVSGVALTGKNVFLPAFSSPIPQSRSTHQHLINIPSSGGEESTKKEKNLFPKHG